MNKWLFRLLLIFFSLVFFISAGFLADYFIKSRNQAAQLDELSDLVEQAKQETISPGTTGSSETAPSGSGDLGFLPDTDPYCVFLFFTLYPCIPSIYVL